MNLLDRAKKLIQGGSSVPVKTQYYNVHCPEGHRLSGARTEGYQALRCPTCGEGIFILPRSVLPEPPAPTSSHPARHSAPVPTPFNDDPVTLSDPPPMTEVGADEAEIEWTDESEPAPAAREPAAAPPEPRPAPAAKPATKPASRPAGPVPSRPAPAAKAEPGRRRASRTAPTPAPAPEQSVAVPAEPFDLRAWVKRRRNTIVFVGTACFVLLTLVYGVWKSNRANFPEYVRIGRTDGIAALDQGRFDTAHQLLSRAKRAVDALGGEVEGADEVRKAADEAAIFAKLAPESLETMLGEAAASDPAEWGRQFSTLYQGRAVIIDATVTAKTEQSNGPRYDLDYRIFPDGVALGAKPPSAGRIDTAGLELFTTLQPKIGDRVLFGVRLAKFEFDTATEQWVVSFEPKSGVQMTHRKALESMGWPNEEPVTAEEVR